MLDWLKQHIKDTPIDIIREEWKEIEAQFPVSRNIASNSFELKIRTTQELKSSRCSAYKYLIP